MITSILLLVLVTCFLILTGFKYLLLSLILVNLWTVFVLNFSLLPFHFWAPNFSWFSAFFCSYVLSHHVYRSFVVVDLTKFWRMASSFWCWFVYVSLLDIVCVFWVFLSSTEMVVVIQWFVFLGLSFVYLCWSVWH